MSPTTQTSLRRNVSPRRSLPLLNATLTSPVAAPNLTLPWITGSPHALYARVRADLGTTTTSAILLDGGWLQGAADGRAEGTAKGF